MYMSKTGQEIPLIQWGDMKPTHIKGWPTLFPIDNIRYLQDWQLNEIIKNLDEIVLQEQFFEKVGFKYV